jgi:hypothetical protein
MVGWDDVVEEPAGNWTKQSMEDGMVKKVMQKTGLIYNLENLRQRCHEATGRRDLNFEWFHDEYPSFPVRLTAKKAYWLRDMLVEDIYKSFTRTTAFRAYESACEELDVDPRSEAFGVIFRWPGIATMVLHNYMIDEELIDMGTSWTRITRTIGNVSPRVTYAYDKLDFLLHAISKEWEHHG